MLTLLDWIVIASVAAALIVIGAWGIITTRMDLKKRHNREVTNGRD